MGHTLSMRFVCVFVARETVEEDMGESERVGRVSSFHYFSRNEHINETRSQRGP